MTTTRVLGLLTICGLAAGLASAHPHEQPAERGTPRATLLVSDPTTETVYYDAVENGRLVGGRVQLPRVDINAITPPASPSPFVTLMSAGEWLAPGADGVAPFNRLNLVAVGDGYQTAQLPAYATHTTTAINQLFAIEPFATYRPYFNVFRVDVVSVDSGVDNDPTQGILRDTALDMAFWCGGTERLLCVNVTKARQQAASVGRFPHQVFAIANSSKYGGAGYTSSDLGTFAGANSSAPEIAIHELGHSLGNLADEYDYGGPAAYTGAEPGAANVSIYTAAQQQSLPTKWFRWLGVNNPAFDGLVDTYVGANYSTSGIYRPTFNSKMRNLGRPFNLPSAESLIVEIYRVVRPVDSASPTPGSITGVPIFSVTLLQPVNNPLSVQWLVDFVPVPGATGTTFDASTLPGNGGTLRTIQARVVDNTSMVRDPALRNGFLTQTVTWTFQPCYANCDNSSVAPALNPLDFTCFIGRYLDGLNEPPAAQISNYANCDGSTVPPVLNAVDFSCFLQRYQAGCL